MTAEKYVNGIVRKLKCSGKERREIKQQGTLFALVQVNAQYENTAVTFTISFDDNMQLAGFYIR